MVEYSEFNERNTHTLRSIIKYLLNTCYKSNQYYALKTEAGVYLSSILAEQRLGGVRSSSRGCSSENDIS